jgi:hypothetical protein
MNLIKAVVVKGIIIIKMKSLLVVLIILKGIFSLPMFRLYKIDMANDGELSYACLDYNFIDNRLIDSQLYTKDQEIIPYCLRPSEKLVLKDESAVFGTKLTFELLNKLNISSRKLLKWSAPIDIAEDYELYLSNNSVSSLNKVFYNCSYGWFGPYCEYTFFSDSSFSEIVNNVFQSKFSSIESGLISITNHTCYVHFQFVLIGVKYVMIILIV